MDRKLEPLLLRPAEVADVLGIARSRAYRLCSTGELPTVRLGKSVRVPLKALKQWVEDHHSPLDAF